MGTVESVDATAEASAAELDAASTKAERACLVMSNTSAAVTSAAVGMTLEAALAWEHVMDPADRKPPFPGELTVGFPGKSKAPAAALMVPATAVAIGVLLAVASGMRKRGGDKKARFPDGLGAIFGVEGAKGAVCCFLLVLVARAPGGSALH
jgi:hypothetical protein